MSTSIRQRKRDRLPRMRAHVNPARPAFRAGVEWSGMHLHFSFLLSPRTHAPLSLSLLLAFPFPSRSALLCSPSPCPACPACPACPPCPPCSPCSPCSLSPRFVQVRNRLLCVFFPGSSSLFSLRPGFGLPVAPSLSLLSLFHASLKTKTNPNNTRTSKNNNIDIGSDGAHPWNCTRAQLRAGSGGAQLGQCSTRTRTRGVELGLALLGCGRVWGFVE